MCLAAGGSARALVFDDIKAKAAAGDAAAQYQVGADYEEGQDVTADDAQALQWYRKSADQGYAAAERKLGGRYFAGNGVEKNLAEAYQWYSKAAAQGDADAQYNLGVMYDYGLGATNDAAEAARWYLKAAQQNRAEAQGRLGELYEEGRGVNKDLGAALKWYSAAADQGMMSAQSKVRELQAQPSAGTPALAPVVIADPGPVAPNKPETNEAPHLVVTHSVPTSATMAAIAQMQVPGPKATNLLIASAAPVAPVPTTPAKAAVVSAPATPVPVAVVASAPATNAVVSAADRLATLRSRAEQGDLKAQFSLGLAYFRGTGVTKDWDQALKWFRPAAEKGNATAQFCVGVIYFNRDTESPTNDVEAYRWFLRAEAQHNMAAVKARMELEKTMTWEQIQEAHQ